MKNHQRGLAGRSVLMGSSWNMPWAKGLVMSMMTAIEQFVATFEIRVSNHEEILVEVFMSLVTLYQMILESCL